MEKKQIKQIEKFLKEFFKKATVEADFIIEQSQGEPSFILIKLESQEPYLLIGREGKTLYSIQHLFQIVLHKFLDSDFVLNIDVNNYMASRIKALEETAVEIANQVALNNTEKEFEPMNSYERRIIHTALAKREDIITESRGIGEERRVVVKPV